jgi:hypothetical protein
MQITIPDELVKAGKIILMTLGAAALIVIVSIGLWHAFAPATVQSAPVVTTPTPVSTPTPYPAYWTNYQRINFLGTSAGFPQANFADGRGFNLPWNLYDNLYLGDSVSFHVIGEYSPYGSTIFYVDDMRVSRYYWGDYTRVVYGNAGRFCIDGSSKYSC